MKKKDKQSVTGRVVKFSKVEDLQGLEDGVVHFVGAGLQNNDFRSKKELTDFMIENIDEVTKWIFDDEVLLVATKYTQQPDAPAYLSKERRIDIVLCGEKHTYLIGLKNPVHSTDNTYALGPLLDYAREFPDPKKELVLITTKFDINAAQSIQHYGLPIRYIYMSKTQSMEFKEMDHD